MLPGLDKVPRFVLGISAYYHDSAACLLREFSGMVEQYARVYAGLGIETDHDPELTERER